MKKLLLSAALSAALFATGTATAKEKVMISDPSWNGARAVGHVIKAIITEQMGGEAEILTGMNQQPVIFAGMDKGDGSIDVHPDMWMPNWQSAWDQYVDGNGTVKTNAGYPGTSKIYVPSYMSDKVKSIQDLNNPEIAAMFDTDGDGLVFIRGCSAEEIAHITNPHSGILVDCSINGLSNVFRCE